MQTYPRLPCPHEYPRRATGHQGAPGEGQSTPERLTFPLRSGGLGLHKAYRLLKPIEFRRVFQQPCRTGDRTLTILARANDKGHARLGLAISSKAAKSAVIRNRIKRIARESFRQHQRQLGSCDYVITCGTAINNKSPRELRLALDRYWHKLSHEKHFNSPD